MSDYYITRINKAIDYIEDNLDKKLTTKDLADVTAFSEFHFHRIFKSITNETVNQYIKRLKMGKSYRNIVISDESITTIAFNYGYSSSANFTRDFRNFYNNSPTLMRNNYNHTFSKSNYPKRLKLKFEGITHIPEMEVIYKRVSSGYNTDKIQKAFQGLLKLIKKNNIRFYGIRSIGIGYDDPDFIEPEKCRYDACISLKEKADIDIEGFNKKIFKPGKCAVYIFEGKNTDFALAWDFIIKTWITSTEYYPGNTPHFEEYMPILSLKKDHYKAKLCLPITKI